MTDFVRIIVEEPSSTKTRYALSPYIQLWFRDNIESKLRA